MVKIIIQNNGFWDCNGRGKCGGSFWDSLDGVKSRFHCLECRSYQKENCIINVKDLRNNLLRFGKKEKTP